MKRRYFCVFDFKTGWRYPCLTGKEEAPREIKDIGAEGHRCESTNVREIGIFQVTDLESSDCAIPIGKIFLTAYIEFKHIYLLINFLYVPLLCHYKICKMDI